MFICTENKANGHVTNPVAQLLNIETAEIND